MASIKLDCISIVIVTLLSALALRDLSAMSQLLSSSGPDSNYERAIKMLNLNTGGRADLIGSTGLGSLNTEKNIDDHINLYHLLESSTQDGPVNDEDEFEAFVDKANKKIADLLASMELRESQGMDDTWNNFEVNDEAISAPINNPLDFKFARPNMSTILGQRVGSGKLEYYIPGANYLRKAMTDSTGLPSDNDDQDDDGSTLRYETETDEATAASRYGIMGGEYIDHPLALIGHQYVQGGAGEGRQLLGPDGTFENVQVIKSDHAVPSYCDPPNPCPIGYTAEDGCLEKFINSASFSREYQAKQQCSCDDEHSLFNCGSPTTLNGQVLTSSPSLVDSKSDSEDNLLGGEQDSRKPSTMRLPGGPDSPEQLARVSNKLGTLARTIQNRFGSLPSVHKLIDEYRNLHSSEEVHDH